MKYLDLELYDKLCSWAEPDPEDERLWNEQCEKWFNEFKRIRHRFPSKFVKEFSKLHFHDYIVSNIQIIPDPKKGNSLKMELNHMENSYRILFTEVNNLKMDFFTDKNSFMQWILCEIYEVSSKRNSISVLFDDGTLSFEFHKIKYSSNSR